MNNIMETLKNLKIWQQLLIIFAILGVIVIASVFAFKPDTYDVLYSNLNPNETVEIEQEIAKMGIQSKINAERTTITIDGAEIPRVKAHLATLGLPSSGDPGFELLDQNSIGATKFDKEKRYERALVGDIQQGLVQGFDFVTKAVVQLNYETQESIFKDDEAESKASVTVHVKGDKSLNEDQVAAVRNFVASSVRNLKAENVDVMDKTGLVYDVQDGSGHSASGYSKQLEITDQTEKRIRNDIMTMLARKFGAENVSLVVRAEINFDEIVRNIEKYDPKGTMVSRQESKESVEKREGGNVVEPGTDSNGTVPDYQTEDAKNGSVVLNQDKNEIIENFEVGKTVETIKQNPELTNIKVTATINEVVGDAERANFIAEWEEIIANAAGIQINQDGTLANGYVKVSPQLFTMNEPEEEPFTNEATVKFLEDKRMITLVFLFGGLGLALLAMFAWFIHKRREEIVVTQHGMPFDGEIPNGYNDTIQENKNKVELSEEEQSKKRSDALIDQIDKQKKTKRIDFGDLTDEQKEIASKAREVAEENPERTAEYIKKLINEG